MIFCYHSVVPGICPKERWCVGQAVTLSSFKRQIKWLLKHYSIISLTDYIDNGQDRKCLNNKTFAITFDDGFARTFQHIFQFLVEMKIPITIFVATAHLEHRDLLWFSYLRALCFEKLYPFLEFKRNVFPLQNITQRKKAWFQLRSFAKTSGDPVRFIKLLSEKYPISSDVSTLYAGMSYVQLKKAENSPYIELGAHTVTHPYLNLLSEREQEEEICGSKRELAELTGASIRYFAYPAGEYNRATINIMKRAGFESAFAIISNNLGYSKFEVERIGIYSSSILKFKLKVWGVANLARRFGLRVG